MDKDATSDLGHNTQPKMSVAQLTKSFAEERSDEPLINLQRELKQLDAKPQVDWGELPTEVLSLILNFRKENEMEYWMGRTHYKHSGNKDDVLINWKTYSAKGEVSKQLLGATKFLGDKHHQKHYKKRVGCACELGTRLGWVPDFYIIPKQLKTKYFLKQGGAGLAVGKQRRWRGTAVGWVYGCQNYRTGMFELKC